MAYTIQGSSQFTTQFPPGTVNIKFSQLRNVFKGPLGTQLPVGIVTTTGEIRARELLRNTNTSDPDPILPDATENTQVSTVSDWKASQMRGTIKFYVIDQTVSTTNDNGATLSAPGFDFDGLNWNNNLTKSIRKFATVSGTCGSNGNGAPAVRVSASSNNMTVVVNSTARIYGAAGSGSGTYLQSGTVGGVALQVDSAQGAVKVYIAAGSNTYGGGSGGARGSAGLQGQAGTCPRDEFYTSGANCGGCPGCAAGWTQYNCYSSGGNDCSCGKGGCGNKNYFSQCTRTVYDARSGAPRGEGGAGAQGRGYNNFSASLTGTNGTAGTPGGCYTYPNAPAGSGSNGETGGSGGDWGSNGSGTTTAATILLAGNGAVASSAGRAISKSGAGPGTGSGNYAILSTSTLTSTELKGYYQS